MAVVTSGIIARPPISIPRTVTFSEIPLGTTSQNKAAFVVWPPSLFGSATTTLNVSAHLDGDPGPFRIVGLALADLVPDPDAHGALSWENGPTINGAGPVPVDVGEAVLVIVEFDCPNDPPQDTFSAVVVLDGLPRKVSMPVVATTNAKLSATIQLDKNATLGRGETKAFPFSISSTLGHDAKATLQYDSTFSPAFSSSTILMDVPKNGTVSGFVAITNISAISVVSHPYPVRFVVSETNGGHSSATTGLIIGARAEDNAPAVDIRLMKAAQDLHQFWATHGGLLAVGLPVGPVTGDDNGSYHLECECGSVLKIDDDKPSNYLKSMFINDVSIVGCRCFASNDVGGDEAYLIASFAWFETTENGTVGKQATMRTDIVENVKSDSNNVIFSNISIGSSMTVGASPINFHVDMWDHESGDPDAIRDQVNAVVQDAISVAAGLATAFLTNVGVGTAAGLVSKIAGLFSFIGGAIGDLVADLFSDDHIGGADLPIDNSYLQRLTGIVKDGEAFQMIDDDPNNLRDVGPQVHEKTSNSLLNPNRQYNFPEMVEDDSAEGRSWLLTGDAAGTYRAFFSVTASALGDPHK